MIHWRLRPARSLSLFLTLASSKAQAFCAANRRRLLKSRNLCTVSTRLYSEMDNNPSLLGSDWVPLPPREESHRDRRRRKRNEQVATEPRKPQPQRRPNRPGFNSYLKVVLDDETLSRLHKMTLQIRDQFAALSNKEASSVADHDNSETAALEPSPDCAAAATSQAPASIAETSNLDIELTEETTFPMESSNSKNPKIRTKKGLTIKPRTLTSLHMTFFFCETLCELPAEELTAFHAQVSEILKQRGFVQDVEPRESITESPAAAGDFSAVALYPSQCFRVTQIRLFPPRRNNLIVAVLEAPDLWCELHDVIRFAAKNGSSQALRDISSYSENRWTPHVTLANLFGGTKADLAKLRDLLQDTTEQEKVEEFLARGCYIAMGGPMPEQVELDWTFSYPKRF